MQNIIASKQGSLNMWGNPVTGKKTSRNRKKNETWKRKKNAMTKEESLKIIIETSEINLSIKQDYCTSVLADNSVTGTSFVHSLEATKNLKT